MTEIFRQLKEKFILKNAREDWKDYRDALTTLANEYAGGSIAVIGAGRCNDIELAALRFDSITLIDVDAAAMREAVDRLSPAVREKINLVETSLTGITEPDMEAFCTQVLDHVREKGRNVSEDAFEACLNTALDQLFEKTSAAEQMITDAIPKANYDVVLCNGVCSQLFSMILFFIRSVAHSVTAVLPEAAKVVERAEKRLSEMNDRLIPVITGAIAAGAKKTAIFGNEDPENAPVEGAHQCIRFLRENYDPKECTLQWIFNASEQVQYRMTIQVL